MEFKTNDNITTGRKTSERTRKNALQLFLPTAVECELKSEQNAVVGVKCIGVKCNARVSKDCAVASDDRASVNFYITHSMTTWFWVYGFSFNCHIEEIR